MRHRSGFASRFVVLLCMAVLTGSQGVFGAVLPLHAPYESYVYDFWGNPVPAPQAYLPSAVLDGEALGIGRLSDPQDLFVDGFDRIYIADTGNHRILVLDRSLQIVQVINEFLNGDEADRFNRPEGIFVTAEGHIYVADTGNGRIVELTPSGDLLRLIGAPEPDIENVFPSNFVYRPKKVGVDPTGRIYVIAQNVYEGLLEFDGDGRFRGFVGAPRVRPSISEIFWSRVATEAQRQRQVLFLPVEFSNLDVGPKGLVYVVKQGVAQEDSIQRLTWDGVDILARRGYHPPMGDINQGANGSVFADIAVRENGMYTVLDRQWGRAFTYDDNGNLLYVFGGIGDMAGLFRRPVALDVMSDDRVIVLDAQGALTVFDPTSYGAAIHEALRLYHAGEYDRSTEMWREVLRMNGNYDMAYTGIGRAHLRRGEVEEALAAFKLGQNRLEYSKAFALYRKERIEEGFSAFMSAFTAALILLYLLRRFDILRRWRERLRLGERLERIQLLAALKYALYVIVHPFDGFWDLKHEKKGNGAAATVILLLCAGTYIYMRQYTGFIFNPRNPAELNVIVEVLSVVVPFGLWTVVNWALTTLMQGKGTLKEIYIASAYALTPLILINVPATLLSNYLRVEEGGFYYLLLGIAIVWTGILLLVSTMMVHDYSPGKALFTGGLIVAGIAVVIFIGLLSITVVNHMVVFLVSVYSEIVFRA